MSWDLITGSLPRLLSGMALTAELLAISLAIGGALAVPIALMRVARTPLLWTPAYAYIFFFRGTPLLVQVFLVYYGLGQFEAVRESTLWPVLREAYWCAIIAFSLNTAAYTAELLRGGIEAVPHGEIEAARACGMSGALLYRRIILPKAVRLALPAYSNEVIEMLKGTALASTITLVDLMGSARVIIARTYAVEIFFVAGVLYLAMTFVITRVFKRVERRLSAHLRPRHTDKVVAQAGSAKST